MKAHDTLVQLDIKELTRKGIDEKNNGLEMPASPAIQLLNLLINTF